MPFNVALTGIRAATADLEVTGNNVANASTTGFKRSRVEFGDLYANSFLSGGLNQIGDGVRVQNISQNFGQGNLSFTENNLDLAINGQGFYILDNAGARQFSRAGAFGVDRQGFVVNNTGMRLQGFTANAEGAIGGALGDMTITADNLAPARTTNVNTRLNLDAEEVVLAQRGTSLATDGIEVGRVVAGTGNGYTPQTLTLTLANGNTQNVAVTAGQSANAIAAALNTVNGVEAAATTQATVTAAGFNNISGTMRVTVNGVPFDNLTDLTTLANNINSSPSLVGVRAAITGGDLVLTDNRGNDIRLDFSGGAADSFEVQGSSTPATSVTLNTGTTQAAIGGSISLVLDDGMSIASGTNNIFSTLAGTPFVNNTFDPADERTYNHTTSTTTYDSLGNPHILSMYFVKEQTAPSGGQTLWTMYTQIDGQDVGDPVTPGGTATRAAYSLVFDDNGTLNETLSDDVLISNWTPLDVNGLPNGADGPLTVAGGGALPIPDPPTSSNFQIDLERVTQFGSPFSVNDMQQNGFTTGRLVGLDVNDNGVIFARYTNGESQVLGQVALANFNDLKGLAPVGETNWAETFKSGAPIIGVPGTGTLGNIRSNSLEDSNVDLSEQLVNLIIAQRNYQANAKTIETANAVTQTIINLR